MAAGADRGGGACAALEGGKCRIYCIGISVVLWCSRAFPLTTYRTCCFTRAAVRMLPGPLLN